MQLQKANSFVSRSFELDLKTTLHDEIIRDYYGKFRQNYKEIY